MATNLVVLMRSERGRKLVREKCEMSGLDIDILERLIEAELDQVGKLKKRGIRLEFDDIFSELEEEDD